MIHKWKWYCRWDGKTYKPLKETDRDGFCCSACKQALYRAHKKYVTLQPASKPGLAGKRVTRKTRKKRRSRNDKVKGKKH